MSSGFERTIPLPKKAGAGEKKEMVPRPAPPPEPSPSMRTLEARRVMTQEEGEELNALVTQLTESSAVTESIKEQRRLLFAIGEELKKVQLDSTQAADAMRRMKGLRLVLGQADYEIEDYFARGTFGAVFLAREDEAEEQDILKMSLPFDRREMFAKPTASVRSVLRAEQIRNSIMEVAALSRLSQYSVSPGKPRKFIERQGAFPPIPLLRTAQFIPHPDDKNLRIQAIVMEKIRGERLDQLIKHVDLAFEPDTLLELAKKLILALQYIHNRGVFHGDLKLSNVMVNEDRDPILLDFGSAQVAPIADRQQLNPSERVVYGHVDNIFGATDYVTGTETLSAPRDVYAMGVILKKILQGSQQRRSTDEQQKRRGDLPELSRQLSSISDQMTLVDPTKRPTVSQLLESLDRLT